MSEVIQKSITLHAEPSKIWEALTTPEELSEWWNDGVVIEPEIGGLFKEPWVDSEGVAQVATGKILEAREKEELKFTWHEKDWPVEWETECSFKIDDNGEERVLTVTHDGWEHLPEDKRENVIKDFETAWAIHLKELKSFIDLSP
ncbi:SRPBCC family protein [Bdellovibrio sp. BCCA]|uniref:SRPBCC family protein n=1 Tax=Bdellovibrio sp. BCCA TaxID=3136281 RepID=UPI0030F13602